MKMTRRIAPLLIALAMAGAPAARAATISETLSFDPFDAFQIAYRTKNAQQETIYLVEPPATLQRWSRMLTAISFRGRAHSEALPSFYSGWLSQLKAACPGIVGAPVDGTIDAHPALRADLTCPLHAETGKAERLTIFAVQGNEDLMLVQIGFQGPPQATDRALIKRIAASLMVCLQPDLTGCADRKPSGFLPGR